MARQVLALGLLVLWPGVVFAQGVPLARFLSNALASAARVERPLGGSTNTAQGDASGHFYQSALKQAAPADFDASLATQISTFPTAFAWGASKPIDGPATEFRMRGGGSSWVEVPATLGRGRFTFTFGHEAVEFGQIDGVNLRGTSLALWTAHDDCCAPVGSAVNPELERDLLEQRFVVDVDRHAYAFYAAVGVTDRLDLGVMVPIVAVRLDARVTSRIVRTATADTFVYGFQNATGSPIPVPHGFDAIEVANRTTYPRGESRGIGDVLVKAKYRITGEADGVAVSVGALIPTGDPDALLGAGSFRGDASLLMSASFGRLNPRATLGYSFGTGAGADALGSPLAAGGATPSTRDVPDVLHATAGLDLAVHRRVQISLDAMGRRISGVPRFRTSSISFPLRGVGASAPTYQASSHLTLDGTSAVLQALAVGTARVFIASRLLCTVEVLVPLNDQGLQPRVGAVAGLSWGF